MKKITLLFALFACLSANAQWVSDTAVNTLVAETITTGSQSIGTTDGQTFIVFWKSVEAPTNFELRVQLLNAAGEQQFGPDGMLVSNTIPMSTYTVISKISIDKNDNLYIGVTGTLGATPAFVFKINTAGTSLWENGLSLGAGYLPTILPLNNGGVVIAYWPGSGKSKMQRYTEEGTPVWANPVDIVGANAASATTPGDFYELSDNHFTAVFHQKFTFGVATNLYAQKYSLEDGSASLATPTQLSNKGTAWNLAYNGTQDGDVVYYAYSGATGLRYDAYVQRINADATVPWGINGMDFDTNATNYERYPSVAVDSGSDYVWAIANYTPSTQDVYGEYVQKFDKATGARQFTDNAKEIFPIDSDSRVHVGKLLLLNDLPLFILKTGMDNGVTPTTLNAVRLDADGNLDAAATLPVATASASKGDFFLNAPVNNQAVVTFGEKKVGDQPRIYAQNFSTAVLATDNFAKTNETIKIYPNPANGIFKITGNSQIESVMAYNMAGQLVNENKSLNSFETIIDAQSWSNGIYIINVKTENGKLVTMKLVKTE